MKKIKNLLCRLGIHQWREIFTGSILSPCGDKCKNCKIVRQFNGWGYTYGWDVKDLPDHIPPQTDNDIVL